MARSVGLLGYAVIVLGAATLAPAAGLVAQGLDGLSLFSPEVWALLDSLALFLTGIALVLNEEGKGKTGAE